VPHQPLVRHVVLDVEHAAPRTAVGARRVAFGRRRDAVVGPRVLRRVGERQADPERAAFAGHAVDADAAAQQLDQALADREPDAGARDRAALRVVPLEGPEQPGDLVDPAAGAAVGDAQLEHPARLDGREVEHLVDRREHPAAVAGRVLHLELHRGLAAPEGLHRGVERGLDAFDAGRVDPGGGPTDQHVGRAAQAGGTGGVHAADPGVRADEADLLRRALDHLQER
jgi:hypothetical protein